MNSLQDQSIRIKKETRSTNIKTHSYTCGGCRRFYRSYPALYLHIKRKHDGIRPFNTKIIKPVEPAFKDKIHTGRPQKPSHDVDGISDNQIYLENAQSELLGFLGERLRVVSMMDSKPKLESVVLGIIGVSDGSRDETMVQLKKKTEELFAKLKERGTDSFDIDLDFDSFCLLDSRDSLEILVWFLLWLGKYVVKFDVLRDFTFIFSKIWKVLTQKQLQIQDLDNKLVWNGVMKECDGQINSFLCFEGKKDLAYDFVGKTCHLIGKIFE